MVSHLKLLSNSLKVEFAPRMLLYFTTLGYVNGELLGE